MNGNWYPWSEGSTPDEYVLAWRHVHDIVSSKDLDSTRLQWVWSVCNEDSTKYTVEEYWVGENYTDWLGIDGYNLGVGHTWSKWVWPEEVFTNITVRLRRLSATKPISINEYGTTSIHTPNATDIQSKTEWLNRMCDYLTNSTDIKIASYFNIDEKTDDYSIFGGTHGDIVWNNFNGYSAYRNCVLSDQWIESDITNPRLITDEQFAGRF